MMSLSVHGPLRLLAAWHEGEVQSMEKRREGDGEGEGWWRERRTEKEKEKEEKEEKGEGRNAALPVRVRAWVWLVRRKGAESRGREERAGRQVLRVVTSEGTNRY